MIDPELRSFLDGINQHLSDIKAKKGVGIWRAFFNGMFGALGYVAGLAVVLVVLFWVLQKTGQLKAFQDQMKNFSEVIDQAKKLTAPSDQNTNNNPSTSSGPNGSGGGTMVTLPNGQQYKVNVSQ